MIESFSQLPLQQVIPSYLYQQYADDDALQAFVTSYNELAQGYLAWFNATPLGLYTASGISGPLLDFVATGLYGMSRPVLSTGSTKVIAGYNSVPYNTLDYNDDIELTSGSSIIASDDIYKRVLTWNLYRGDGNQFNMLWLKRRIWRFIDGANGTDTTFANDRPSVTVSNGVFTVTDQASQAYTDLQLAYANGFLAFPFQYSMAFLTISLFNDEGVLQTTAVPLNYPTNPMGLADGAVWYNGGTFAVVPGITPPPSPTPVYFGLVTPAELLASGGGDLPLSDPANLNQLWNNGGVICISGG